MLSTHLEIQARVCLNVRLLVYLVRIAGYGYEYTTRMESVERETLASGIGVRCTSPWK
jgi:hypothetical protein